MSNKQIHINQIGYTPNQSKLVAVANAPADVSTFELINEQGQAAFNGKLTAPNFDFDTGDSVAHGDFTAFKTPGQYRVRVAGVGESYPFTISETAYQDVLKLAARWLYLQRSGVEKNDPVTGFTHKADHVAPAILWDADGQHPDQTFDVSGGWWDAGDYGRYTPPAATTIMSLLYAYRFNLDFFRDGSLQIPESGNDLPDLLDEIRWELNWLFKMQRGDGAVHHKVTNTGFPGEEMPDAVTLPLYLYDVSTWSTAQFAGVLAEASVDFRPFDAAYADKLLEAARRAWGWLQQTPNRYPEHGFSNPEPSGGPYNLPNRDEAEYRLWAAASLFHATGEREYGEAFKQGWKARDMSQKVYSLYWWGGYIFACTAYLDTPAGEQTIKDEIKSVLADQCRTVLHVINHTGYRVALTGNSGEFGYDWGSNAMTLGNGLLLLLGASYLPTNSSRDEWVAGAAAQLDYILGLNSLGKCYFSGAGADPVQQPHHRPSVALGRTLPGIVGEGANAMNVGGDTVLQELFDEGVPYGRRYADHKDSWATNEPTIYGNAAFVAVASWFSR